MNFLPLTDRLLWNPDSIVAVLFAPGELPAHGKEQPSDADLRLYVDQTGQESGKYRPLAILGAAAEAAWRVLEAERPAQLTPVHSRLWVDLAHTLCVELVDKTQKQDDRETHREWVEVLLKDQQRIGLEADLSEQRWPETVLALAGSRQPVVGVSTRRL